MMDDDSIAPRRTRTVVYLSSFLAFPHATAPSPPFSNGKEPGQRGYTSCRKSNRRSVLCAVEGSASRMTETIMMSWHDGNAFGGWLELG